MEHKLLKLMNSDADGGSDQPSGAINSSPHVPGNDNFDPKMVWDLFNWAMNHDPNVRR